LSVNIFGRNRDINKRLTALSTTIAFALNKKIGEFDLLTPEITRLMFNIFKSTMRVLRMLIHDQANVILLTKKFQFPEFSFNRTYGAGRTHVGFFPKILVVTKMRRTTLTIVSHCIL